MDRSAFARKPRSYASADANWVSGARLFRVCPDMAIDELQQIAQARAIMMMRGFEPLKVEIGPETNRQLGRAISEDGILLDMRVTVRSDMEGFAVRPERDR